MSKDREYYQLAEESNEYEDVPDNETTEQVDEGALEEIELLRVMRERFDNAIESDQKDRMEAAKDIRFGVLGEQWDQKVRKIREENDRPCLTINKLPELVEQVVGTIKKSNPTIKVRPVDDFADVKTAEIINGLLRNIQSNADGDIAYKDASESSVWCGRGFFRILTEYNDDDTFDQDILIEPINDRFRVSWDPSAKRYDKRDGKYWFIEDKIFREDFELAYPNIPLQDWDSSYSTSGWITIDEVRIVEYFVKEPIYKVLCQLEDGRIMYLDDLEEERQRVEQETGQPVNLPIIKKQRSVEANKILWYKACGGAILEGPIVFPGKYIPIIPVWGKETTIDGERFTRGAIRYARDPQLMYNYWRTTATETAALAPRVPFVLTAKQLGNHKDLWDSADRKNLPYLLIDADPHMAGYPQRSQGSSVTSAFAQEAAISDSEIRGTVGIHNPSIGQGEGQKSGKAILALQEKADVGSYAYLDNLVKSLKHAGRIIVGIIPHIYDTERIIRVVNPDGKSDKVVINSKDEQGSPLHDLTVGKYDVTVDIGPSYKTQRMEAFDSLMSFVQQVPGVAGMVADLIARNSDWKDADEFEARLRKMLPPGVVEPREGEELPGQQQDGQQGGKPGPEQIAQAGEMLKVKSEVKQEEEKLRGLKLDNEKKRLELVGLIKDTGLMSDGLPPGVTMESLVKVISEGITRDMQQPATDQPTMANGMQMQPNSGGMVVPPGEMGQ